MHGFDTRDDCVYDLDGRASQLAIGGMLETMRIAATAFRLRAKIDRRPESTETKPLFDVRFAREESVVTSPLVVHIRTRTVQRRPMRTRPLAASEKQALESSVGPAYRVIWIEGLGPKWRMARLLWRNGKLRLTIPEGYEVHRSIIEWDAQFSEDRVPDRAVGLDVLGTRLMRWALVSWKRVDFLNRYLGGTLLPRLQLDLVPSVACAAHFAIAAVSEPRTIDDFSQQVPQCSISG